MVGGVLMKAIEKASVVPAGTVLEKNPLMKKTDPEGVIVDALLIYPEVV